MRVVVDTNVFVSAVMGANGASREILRRCFLGDLTPVIGNALFSKYEDVCGRDVLFDTRLISRAERDRLLDAFMQTCEWVPIYFLWRPNLPDEKDNHLLELAIAGNAEVVTTANKRDFQNAELWFPGIRVLNPQEFLSKGRKAK